MRQEGGRGKPPKIGSPCWCLRVPLGRPGDWVLAGCKDFFGFINVRLRDWTEDGACVGALIASSFTFIFRAPIA